MCKKEYHTCTVYTRIDGREITNIRSYTVHMYGFGQPCNMSLWGVDTVYALCTGKHLIQDTHD